MPEPQWRRETLLASPLLQSLRPVLERCHPERFPGLAELNALAAQGGLASGGGVPLRFVEAPPTRQRKFEEPYEVRIFRHGAMPTRVENWHDIFNALVWLTFPRTKATLNRQHTLRMLERQGESRRGTARDVLTLFDEGGVIVASQDAGLSALLRERCWKELFWHRRAEVRAAMRFFVFGHAIHEKGLAPYKAVTAKALILEIGKCFFDLPLAGQLDHCDEGAAAYFSDPAALASTKALPPLPILGVPGWEPANEAESFYDDEQVFRPAGEKAPGSPPVGLE